MKSLGNLETENLEVPPSRQVFEYQTDRVDCSYSDLSEKFRHKKKDFGRQYAHVYCIRLNQMKDGLVKRAEQKWGSNLPVRRLAELEDDIGGRCIVIGTLFKDQELRPSILKEISDELQIVPQKKLVRFISDSDKIILEDEVQRIVLTGNIDVQSVVTGLVCAVLGKEDESGKFQVEDICFPGPQAPSPLIREPKSQFDKYMLMVSGIDIATSSCLPRLQLLVHWASGWIGRDQAQIALMLIAGGLIKSKSDDQDGKIVNTNIDTSTDILTAIQLADDLLHELSETMHVELMPGEFDPTNYLLPQQPIHFRMFPKAIENKTFNGGTNPHSFQVDNIIVSGSSGQPVREVGRYSNITDPLEGLEATLHWGHITPTSPDSLGCYPYFEKDPFIIEEQPHVFFSSNHEVFQTKLLEYDHGSNVKQTTRLVCIPSFSKTNTAVLVNLSNLECKPFSIEVP